MMLESSKFKNFRDEQDIPKGGTIKSSQNVDFSTMTIYNRSLNKGEIFNRVYKFNKVPTYFYLLDELIPLWFALRFYPFDREEVVVNHNAKGYDMPLEIRYMGKERVRVGDKDVLCHKFRLRFKVGLLLSLIQKPKDAYIWLTAEDETRYMVRYINDNRQSSFFQSMEYRLVEVRRMSLEEWERFKVKIGIRPDWMEDDWYNQKW